MINKEHSNQVTIRRRAAHNHLFPIICVPDDTSPRERRGDMTAVVVLRFGRQLKRCTFLSCIALLIFTCAGLYAQGGRGTINGTVTDSTGAVVPGAQITIKSLETAQVTTLSTTTDGSYSAPFLSLGAYEITAAKTGFATETQTGITLTTDQIATVNFALKPGTVTSTVEVSATAVQLDTTTGAISQEINQKSIVELPLDGRNPAELVYYAPAAVNGNQATGAIGLPGSGSGFPNAGPGNGRFGQRQPDGWRFLYARWRQPHGQLFHERQPVPESRRYSGVSGAD